MPVSLENNKRILRFDSLTHHRADMVRLPKLKNILIIILILIIMKPVAFIGWRVKLKFFSRKDRELSI